MAEEAKELAVETVGPDKEEKKPAPKKKAPQKLADSTIIKNLRKELKETKEELEARTQEAELQSAKASEYFHLYNEAREAHTQLKQEVVQSVRAVDDAIRGSMNLLYLTMKK